MIQNKLYNSIFIYMFDIPNDKEGYHEFSDFYDSFSVVPIL